MSERPTRDLAVRLRPFIDRGLIRGVPTEWQLLQGQLEMAPYVVMPDAGDRARYAGAPLGHPLARQPLLVWQIGLDHFRVGHGLHTAPDAQFRHLNFVFHEGMPTYDLQVCQTFDDGIGRMRRFTQEIEDGATPTGRRLRRLVDLVIPDAAAYRRAFLEPGGYLDRAEAFDYPAPDGAAPFLRPEFTSLTAFIDYCLERFEPRPDTSPLWRRALHLGDLATRRLREWRVR